MNFPTLSMLPDGDSLQIEADNPAIEPQDTDGGYLITRPQYTRTPPRTFSFMYSDLGQADRDALDNFWNQVKGSSVAFNWTDPTSGTVYNVRFDKGFKLQLQRWGVASNHRYKTNTIVLVEV